MRQYRGKRKDNPKEWVYGCLSLGGGQPYDKNATFIEPTERNVFVRIPVLPETVCQSTGLFDKNGVETYGSIEINGKLTKGGDIVRHLVTKTPKDVYVNKEVIYDLGSFKMQKSDEDERPSFLEWPAECCLEIIGNTIDNPDLLKG